MFWWLPKSHRKILVEADEFMESLGNSAYQEARYEARKARERGDHKREKFLSRAAVEIAKRTDFEPGLDTATRYLEEPLAINRSKDATIH